MRLVTPTVKPRTWVTYVPGSDPPLPYPGKGEGTSSLHHYFPAPSGLQLEEPKPGTGGD